MPQLTLEQRYEISYLKKRGFNNLTVSIHLGVNSTTIKRELERNSDARSGIYEPKLAQKKAESRHVNKAKSIRFTQSIKDFVIYWLKQDYSQEQIVGKAKN